MAEDALAQLRSLHELATKLRNSTPTSWGHDQALAEIQLHQTIAQIEATEALKKAAASQESAGKWAFWTVHVAGLSTVVTATATLLAR